MNAGTRTGHATGFTLLELLIVLFLFAVLAATTAPSLKQLLQTNRLKTEASRLLSAINLARSEAIHRNTVVALCPSEFARTGEASCGGNFAQGWIVFTNANGDNQFSGNSEAIIQAYQPLPPHYSLTNRAGNQQVTETINYRPDGSSRRNRTLMLCARDNPAVSSLSVVLNMMGRPRLAKDWGECPPV